MTELGAVSPWIENSKWDAFPEAMQSMMRLSGFKPEAEKPRRQAVIDAAKLQSKEERELARKYAAKEKLKITSSAPEPYPLVLHVVCRCCHTEKRIFGQMTTTPEVQCSLVFKKNWKREDGSEIDFTAPSVKHQRKEIINCPSCYEVLLEKDKEVLALMYMAQFKLKIEQEQKDSPDSPQGRLF